MKTLLRGASVYRRGALKKMDVVVDQGRIISLSTDILPGDFDIILELHNLVLLPGLVDVHVHLREPGFSYKETIETGTRAAARGGYTGVCAMPNLIPAPDSPDHLMVQLTAIAKTACIPVYPYGTITAYQKGGGELTDYAALADSVVAFSDDGRGVQSEDTMRAAMQGIYGVGGLLAAHCEDERYLNGGYIHDGEYAKAHGHKGISSESEWKQVERDIRLVRETNCRYHVCHVSTKESVALIRAAKAEGLPVTCETAPHYLVLTDADLQEDGRFKMNPPIRAAADRDALVEGLLDGTIDIIATDHAPHSAEEKSRGLSGSVMGIVGLEGAFAIMYTHFVKPGIMPLERLIELMSEKPREIFRLDPAEIETGSRADLIAVDLECAWTIDSHRFTSMGRASPFDGMQVFGKNKMTMAGGNIVWSEITAHTRESLS